MSARITIGSAEHRSLFCRFFMESHLAYEPREIDWPVLGDEDMMRLTRLPFWNEAVETEHLTSKTVQAAADLAGHAQIREAIALQGYEESRHARLLAELTRFYGIEIDPPAPLPAKRNVDWDFLYVGYGECFDSFFAFGLFELAKKSGFLSREIMEVFEPVLQEEARHILFFVNWLAYRQSNLPWWRRIDRRLRRGVIIALQIWSRIKTAWSMSKRADGENFTLSGHRDVIESLSLRQFLSVCLEENEKRFAAYDPRLLRPRLVPNAVRFVRWFLPK
jgi:hypothetical protein